jgi:hypothetical protein
LNKWKHIKALEIKDLSGFSPKPGSIPFIKKHHYFVVKDITITGDAPKDFIRFYQYGEGRKANPDRWPLYLAKHGNKHYPIEAITEFLLNRIGETYGFNMAESCLGWLGGQIRFLSKYFIRNPFLQVLDHGADLYAGYLNDRDFVEEIERQHQSSEYFTVQFTKEVFDHFFSEDGKSIMNEFLKLLILDALIGNNDRHFYNWGILRNVKGDLNPIFSPIYDTARGLFWNDHEDKIRRWFNNKSRLQQFIRKYSDSSTSKIGYEGCKKVTHFELIENLKDMPLVVNCEMFNEVCSDEKIKEVTSMIDSEFKLLLSHERREMIKMCLVYRHEMIRKILTFAP